MERRGGILDPGTPDQKPVGVDAIGGAGQQGAEVFPRNDLDVVGFVGEYHLDLIYLVGDGAV